MRLCVNITRKEHESDFASLAHLLRAQMAIRHKKSAVRHLSVWARQQTKRAGEQDNSLRHMTIGRSLKLAAKQYGRLVTVLRAAEDYINSPSKEDDERLLAALTDKVMKAREIVQTDLVSTDVETQQVAAEREVL